MSLVHRVSQLADDVVALECHRCRASFRRDEIEVEGDELFCGDPECRAGGLIAHRTALISERFPAEIATPWTAIPDALMDHRSELDLGPHEILVVIALERHRRAMGEEGHRTYPSRQTLAHRTGLSEASVKRAIARLARLGLIRRWQPRFVQTGIKANNRYDLDPLWDRLAAVVRGSP